MAKMVRLISKYCGNVRPDSVEDYVKAGGYAALKKAMGMGPLDIIEEVKKSKLMGRGGAAYPTGIKWEQAYSITKNPKYIVCNGDEGEPGTYKDRLMLGQNPLQLIEGMTIAARVLDAREGYIYIRGEYKAIQETVKKAIENAVKAGYLGDNILGTQFSFHLEVVSGAGAYVCGENTALVESIEGKAGRPRIKPPFIKNAGLYLKPTLLNNVETFSCIPYIIDNGGDNFASYGNEHSGGTKLVSLSGNVENRDVYEVPFGITLRELVYEIGGGIPEGRTLKMVQLGGSSGACFPEAVLDTQLCYKDLKSKGISLGSGAVLVLDDSNCIVDFVKCIMEFFVHESCGKCTPCREGNRHILMLVEKFADGTATKADFEKMKRICDTMKYGAFCGLGQTATTALITCLKYFKEEFEEHIEGKCRAGVCSLNGKEAK